MTSQIPGKQRVKAVLFDFDGTLWDPEPHIFQGYREAFQECGYALPSGLWSSLIGTVGADLWRRLEELAPGTLDRARAQDEVRRRTPALLAAATLRPGVRRVLCAIDTAGLPRGIVSNSDLSWIRRYSRQCGIEAGWSTVRCADGDRKVAKPSPQLYCRALADLGIEASEAIAFEDSPAGVRAAVGAGIYCVAVPNEMTIGTDLDAANLLVRSFEELDAHQLLDQPSD